MSAVQGSETLGVIVLSYGHDEEFTPLVRDLLDRHGLAPDQITVAHNPFGAEDGWSPTLPEGVRLVRLPDNRGYAGGMNEAILSSGTTRWLLLLTHDARLEEGSLPAMLQAGERDQDVGIVGPRLMLEDGSVWSTGVNVRLGVARHVSALPPGSQPIDRDAVDGTILLVRPELIRRIGGFEERFFMYWEETEFCLRARRAGWRVVVAPDAVAVTRPGSTRRHAVHAYLLTRNGLAFGWADARLLGLAGQLWDAGLRCFNSMPHPIATQWRNRRLWRVAAERTIGTGAGALDFVRRRWGKPPASLRRRSDIA